MADNAEDVLELVDEIDDLDEDVQTDGVVADDEGEEETAIGFSDEEAAPASEGDSSVIRDLRKANRELAKKLSLQERANQPQAVEVGEKPSMASCEYDEERFEAELDQWKGRKAQADQQAQELQSRAEAVARKNQERVEAFRADKALLRVTDFETAEEEVEASLPAPTMALLMRTGKPAALLYALAKSPDRLAALSKLDPSTELVEAALMLGELGAKLKMETRRAQVPERRISGNAGFAPSTDKEYARLEKEADRTGDRSALSAYRRKHRA